MIALLRPNAKEKAKNETYLNENVVISGNFAQLPGECNLCNVSEQACSIDAEHTFISWSKFTFHEMKQK